MSIKYRVNETNNQNAGKRTGEILFSGRQKETNICIQQDDKSDKERICIHHKPNL